MATLEIHEVGRRVRRVRIGRSQPVMFGTNPLCDVPIDDPTLRPYHGRIRWSKNRFKVEVVGDVPFVEVNGSRVVSKGLRQGDEVHAGHTRIFLLSVEDDGPDHGEKTIIQEPPRAAGAGFSQPAAGVFDNDDFAVDLAALAAQAAAEAAGGHDDIELKPLTPANEPPPRPPAPDYHRMEMAPPSLEMPSAADDADPASAPANPPRSNRSKPAASADPGYLPRGRGQSRRPAPWTAFDDLTDLDADEIQEGVLPAVPGQATRRQPGPAGPSWPTRLAMVLRGTDRPPDDDRVLTSPVVIALALTFVILVGLSAGLYQVIVRNIAANQFAAAADGFERGDFPAAIKGYDGYLATLPEGSKAGKARVYRALSRVRQHTAAASGSWNNAYKEAEAMLGEVSGLPEYRDVSVELADDLRKVAEGMLERARDLADPAWLKQADTAIALHARVAGQATDALVARSKIPVRLDEARRAIRKAADLRATLAAIDAAIGSNRPGEAYRARTTLLRRYPDLTANKEIGGRLGRINDLIHAGVRLDPSARPGEAEPRVEPLGPPSSLVLRLDPGRAADPAGRAAFALADGWAWGLDASTGAPLWQAAVGLACPFPPVAVGGAGAELVLLIDARLNELACREARTGRLRWRQPLEGWAADPPLVLGSRVFQPMVDGRLLDLDLRTGDLRGTLRLGRRVVGSPVASEAGDRAYLLGAADCLFVLKLDPLGCEAVEFLGHEEGAVAASPTRAGRLLVLAENSGLDSGRWRAFLGDAAGAAFRQVQEIPVGGWSWGPPAASGSVLWSASDRGEVAAFSIGRLDQKDPITPIARIAPGPDVQGPAYPRARSDREAVVASGLSARYDLDLDRGVIAPAWTLGAAGRALAPPQVAGPLTIFTQQPESGPGAAFWGVDTRTGEVRWRTVLGAAWPGRWAEAPSSDALVTLLADGSELKLTRDRLRAGGFVEQPLPRPGHPSTAPPGSTRLEAGGASLLVADPHASTILIRDPAGATRPVPLPAALAAPPLPLGRNLLVPGIAGRLYLVEPTTGLAAADPFVPPFDRSRPTRWRDPVAVDGEAAVVADSEGLLRRVQVEAGPRPRLVVAAERRLDSPALTSPASTGAAILIVTADLKVRAFAGRDLAPLGSWPLATPPVIGPVAVGGFGFVADARGQVTAFDADGRRLWSALLREPSLAGPPAIRGDAAWFLGRDGGGVEGLSLVDGLSVSRTRLDVEPTGGPLPAGDDLVLPTGSGTLQTFDPAGGAPR